MTYKTLSTGIMQYFKASTSMPTVIARAP